ncbi:hypothetical protein D9615_007327 [Tricholomella constricta]|uniref:F-box domain-containing protein n=1 Tax=Tricholomella constricta TaxID=117010 RepID=A0A8H5M147_9AGAR|nr:hypothetical protein D9615_007327 [Tricholomella constricta]
MKNTLGSTDSLVLTSIASLPEELLCAIFSFLYDDNDGNLSTSLLLSHVCSDWREIALDLPWLWTKVRITQHNHTILEDILMRSNNRPLDVCVYLPDPTPQNATFGLWSTLILLARELKRCHSLDVSAPSPTYGLMRNAFIRDLKAPLLASLKLRRQGRSDGECVFPSVAFNPKVLTYVALDGVGLQSADLNGVRTLVLKQVNASWLPDCLGPDNALESLYLSRTSLQWSGRTLETPHLAHVTLRGQNPFPFLHAAWYTPELRSLTMSRLCMDHWMEILFFLSHVDPHPEKLATLTTLTLADCKTKDIMSDGDDVAALIEATPGLRRFNFEGKEAHPEPVLEVHDVWGGWPLLSDVYVDGVRVTKRGDGRALWRYERVRREDLGLKTNVEPT